MSNPPTIWSAGLKTVTVQETEDHVAAEIRVTCGNPDFTKRISRIVAEAGDLYEQTGLTPRQLAEQRNELRELLRALLISKRHGNGYQAWLDIETRAEAAIAKAEDRT